MTVLALDIAARATGAAWDGPDGRPRFQTFRQLLDGDEFGAVGARFQRWLTDLIAVIEPEEVAFEAPWVPSGSRAPSHPTDSRIPRMMIGLAFLAETTVHALNATRISPMDVSEAEASTVRVFFVGKGRRGKGDPDGHMKRLVRSRCVALGWEPIDEHQCDAAAVWAYTKEARGDRLQLPPPSPLFSGKGSHE